ncbi:MAG: ABC-F family ATP-binding cassette domain-containing protein [Hyphomicrobium sp.]
MAPPLLTLKDIHLTFGGTPLLTGAEISVQPGERICVVGRNGSGKSTLLKIAAGLQEADKGERFAHPGALVRYLAQEPDASGFETVGAYVESGLGPADDPFRARYLIEDLGLSPDAEPARLSGGELKRAAIARVLAPEPDVLILDEPTNHLDLPAIEWLERALASMKSAVVLVSHDRRFLERLSRATVWIDRGVARRIEKGFGAFEAWRDEVLEQEEMARHKLDRKIVREEQWMHGGVTARRKRNVRRVAELAGLRSERREQRNVQGNVRLAAADGGQSSRLVVEATDLSKSFGGRTIVEQFSTRILRGDCVGIVGPNGAGKTTLIKLLTGSLAPDGGSVRLGVNLELVSLDQHRDELNPEWTVADALTGGRGDQVVINGRARHVASYMKDFLFTPEQTRSPLKVLSGGERGRLMLARALAKPSNVLVLDEPTNDLDLETLDLLQELLADYPGTVILVSHDRDFLDRVVTSVIAAEGDGRWTEYAGGYSDMLVQRGSRQVSDAPTPTKAGPGSAKVSDPEGQTPTRKRKLSFREKHALESLPATMDALHKEIETLQARLSDPALYNRDARSFADATSRLAAAQGKLSAAEDQWLELEALREELEA